jgi:hypothetical protein
VAVFNDWVKRRNFPVQKLEAQLVPGMRIGAIATSYIAPEELYLSVTSACFCFIRYVCKRITCRYYS